MSSNDTRDSERGSLPGASPKKSDDLRDELAYAVAAQLGDTVSEDRVIDAVDNALSAGFVREVVSHQTMVSGPLPPPDIMRDYDAIVPGAAERILATYEAEQTHRQEMTRQQLKSESQFAFRGLYSGWSVATGLLLLAGFCAYIDQPNVALACLAASAVGLVGQFISQRL